MFKGLFISHVGDFIKVILVMKFFNIKSFCGYKIHNSTAVSILCMLLVFFPSIGKCGLFPLGNKINESIVGDLLCVELVVKDVSIISEGGFKLCDGGGESFFEFGGFFDEPLSLCMGSSANDSDESRQKNTENGDEHLIHDDWTRGILTGLACCLIGQCLGFYLSKFNS